MAFSKGGSRDVRGNDDSWKADGFLNFFIPGQNGARKKLGAIPLKDSIKSQADLRAWLEEDPSRVAVILAKLEIQYQSAEAIESNGFDLSTPAPAQQEQGRTGTEG